MTAVLNICLFLVISIVTSQAYQCPFANLYQSHEDNYHLPSAEASSAAVAHTTSYENEEHIFDDHYPEENLYSPLQNFHDGYENVQSKPLRCLIPPQNCTADNKNLYYRTLDGTCNNFQYPGYGAVLQRYLRLLPAHFGDGDHTPTVSVSGNPLPNARSLSLTLFGEETKADDRHSLAFMQFGQIVAHDLSQLSTKGAPEDCCADNHHRRCFPIALGPHDPITRTSGKECLHFARTISDLDIECPPSYLPHSEKISLQTAFLDLSPIYGNSIEDNSKFRLHKNGLLKSHILNNRHWLPIANNETGQCGPDNMQCFDLADIRNRFTPTIVVLHTILMREHNRLAEILYQLNPHYSDDQLFEEARKINIAQYQKIVYYDWLKLTVSPEFAYDYRLIHHVDPYEYVNDYDPSVNTATFASFAAAAFRYAHNQIPGYFSLVALEHGLNSTLRLSDHFERAENIDLLLEDNNMDYLINGLTSQTQKRADRNIDPEIKHFFAKKAFDVIGQDLRSFDIHRGRDYGLPSYNQFRQYCGLRRAVNWYDFTNEIDPKNVELLQKLYETPDDVELGVGGAMERHMPNSLLGRTLQCIIGKEFLKTRVGDRFFFENGNIHSGFTRDQLASIRKVTLSSLFCSNGNYLKSIQANSFLVPDYENIVRDCKEIPQLDLNLWKDYRGNSIY